MIKKILIILALFFSLFSFAFAVDERSSGTNLDGTTWDNGGMTQDEVRRLQTDLGVTVDGMIGPETRAAMASAGSSGGDANDITSPDFEIDIWDITPGVVPKKNTAKENAQALLETIITKLIVAFGVLAMLVMTIGGGYMIMYHGQDELLSKGKSIFNAGLIALAVALSSGLLVKLVAYFLY